MKRFLFMVLLAISTISVMAQEKVETGHATAPYNFIGLQGGVQNTFNSEFNNWKTFTPTASVSFGRWFIPQVGARLHVNGAWSKSGVNYLVGCDKHYNYNYITPTADVLVNLCTLFGKKDWYPVNLIFVGGLGANYAFENAGKCEEKAPGSTMIYYDNDSRWAFNGKVGLMLDIPICKWVSFNLEADLNARAAGKHEVFNDDILQFVGQAGLTFKFGYKKPKKEEPVVEEEPEPEPVYATRIDTIWYDDITYKDVTADRDIKKEIFFGVREDGVSAEEAQIAAVAEFLKGVKNGEINIIAYADKETGNPRVNMQYSKQRAENTKQALIEKGVDPNMIKSIEWKGDTVQPYAENDKNRVSIITGHGVYTTKEKVVTKKFRTKEVRERVK